MDSFLKIVFFVCIACFASSIGCQNEIYAQPSSNTIYKYNHPAYDMAVEDIDIDFEHAGEDYLYAYVGDRLNTCGIVASNGISNTTSASRIVRSLVIKCYQNFLRQVTSTTIKVGKTIDCRTIISRIEACGLLPMASKSSDEFIALIGKFNIEP